MLSGYLVFGRGQESQDFARRCSRRVWALQELLPGAQLYSRPPELAHPLLNAPGRGRACKADCKAPEAPGHLLEALAQLFCSSVWGGIGRDSQHFRDPFYPPLGVATRVLASYHEGHKGSRRVRSKASPLLVGISMLVSTPLPQYLTPAILPISFRAVSFVKSLPGPGK